MTEENKKIITNEVLAIVAIVVLAITIYYITHAYASHNPIADSNANAEPQMPIMDVKVVAVEPEKVRVWSNFSGRVAAVNYVEVRPRVGGTIQKVLFEEGGIVNKGAPLFLIDPRPFEAAVKAAEASLASANSAAKLAKAELKRAERLVKKDFASESRYDSQFNDYKVSLAAIDAAKALLTQAKLDLEYANIAAPISGRISRAEITEGNVIEALTNPPVLTTIVSNDKYYAEFDVDEQTYLMIARKSQNNSAMPITITLPNNPGFVYQGKIHAFDNRLNTSSGTIRARAIFENKDGILTPGMYVNVKLGSALEEKALLVPEKSIGTDQTRKFVYIVGEENKIEYREVKLGEAVNNRRIITNGLETGEMVVVNSIQRVFPGMPVNPVKYVSTRGESDT